MAQRHSTFSRTALLACAAIVALSACSKSEPEIAAPGTAVAPPPVDTYALEGLTKGLITAPDEFSVITRRPLEMPNSVAQLPTPEPGKRSTRVPNPKADARAALARGWGGAVVPGQSILPASLRAATRSTAPSAVESAMLSAVGSPAPNILQTLEAEEAARIAGEGGYLLDRVIPGLATLRENQNPDILDIEAEKERLANLNLTTTGAIPAAPAVAPITVSAPAMLPIPATVSAPNYVSVPLDPSFVSAPQIAAAPVTMVQPQIIAPTATAPLINPIAVQPAPSAVPTFGTQPVTVRETEGGLIFIE